VPTVGHSTWFDGKVLEPAQSWLQPARSRGLLLVMRRWSLVAVISLGCDAGGPDSRGTPPEQDNLVEVKQAARVAAPAKHVGRFDVVLEEIAVDRPLYPVPRNFRARKDARAIMEDVEHAVRREIDRIAGCVNEPKSAAIQVWWQIAPAGSAFDVTARATLTSPGQDPVRDNCIADVIRGITFSRPGRLAPIELELLVRTND
jgi:hypothetical protein